MTPRRSTARARKMAFKREMLAEIARLRALAARLLAEFDGPAMGAESGVVGVQHRHHGRHQASG
jgi:hypothetical protein